MAKFELNSGKLTDGGVYKYHGYKNYNGNYDNLGYMQWNTNEYYFGQWRSGKRTGNGVYLFPDTGVYLGSFNEAKRDGLGLYSFTNNAFYFGNYKDNKRNGYGVYVYNNGDWLFGQYLNDKIHGKAVYYFAATKTFAFRNYDNGAKLDDYPVNSRFGIIGNWDNSRITVKQPSYNSFTHSTGTNDNGTSWVHNGQENFKGEWEGVGLIEWNNDSYYFGEWINNARGGVGYLKFTSGSYYLGGFKKVNFHGKGLYCVPSKNKAYFANYDDHKQVGHLFILHEDGSLYYGNSVNDYLEGEVLVIEPNFTTSYNRYRENKYIEELQVFPFPVVTNNFNSGNSNSNNNGSHDTSGSFKVLDDYFNRKK